MHGGPLALRPRERDGGVRRVRRLAVRPRGEAQGAAAAGCVPGCAARGTAQRHNTEAQQREKRRFNSPRCLASCSACFTQSPASNPACVRLLLWARDSIIPSPFPLFLSHASSPVSAAKPTVHSVLIGILRAHMTRVGPTVNALAVLTTIWRATGLGFGAPEARAALGAATEALAHHPRNAGAVLNSFLLLSFLDAAWCGPAPQSTSAAALSAALAAAVASALAAARLQAHYSAEGDCSLLHRCSSRLRPQEPPICEIEQLSRLSAAVSVPVSARRRCADLDVVSVSSPRVLSAISAGINRHLSDARLQQQALAALVSVTNARSPGEADQPRRAAVAAGVMEALAASLGASEGRADLQLRALGADIRPPVRAMLCPCTLQTPTRRLLLASQPLNLPAPPPIRICIRFRTDAIVHLATRCRPSTSTFVCAAAGDAKVVAAVAATLAASLKPGAPVGSFEVAEGALGTLQTLLQLDPSDAEVNRGQLASALGGGRAAAKLVRMRTHPPTRRPTCVGTPTHTPTPARPALFAWCVKSYSWRRRRLFLVSA